GSIIGPRRRAGEWNGAADESGRLRRSILPESAVAAGTAPLRTCRAPAVETEGRMRAVSCHRGAPRPQTLDDQRPRALAGIRAYAGASRENARGAPRHGQRSRRPAPETQIDPLLPRQHQDSGPQGVGGRLLPLLRTAERARYVRGGGGGGGGGGGWAPPARRPP